MSRPAAAPSPPVAPSTEKALARARWSGKVLLTRASTVGARSAAKAPWTARAVTSTAKDGARPPARLARAKPLSAIA